MPLAEKNKKHMTAMDTYAEVAKSVTPWAASGTPHMLTSY